MKVLNFIICDDIRNELGNKKSLMGIYDDTIEFIATPEIKNIWPKMFRIGIYAKIKLEDEDESEISMFKLHIKYNNKKIDLGEGQVNTPKLKSSKKFNIAMVHPSFVFEEPGVIEFYFDFLNAEKKIIETISPDLKFEVKEKMME